MSGDVDVVADEREEMPRHTRPFRAWGAAQERSGPSLWERLLGFFQRLFARRKTEDDAADESPESAEFVDEVAVIEEVEVVEEVTVVEAVTFVEPDPVMEEAAVDEPKAEVDPLWDEPAVAETQASAPPTLGVGDFDQVWTPRDEPAVEPVAEAEPIVEEPPKKLGFFARLFSRKKKSEEIPDHIQEHADAWASEVREISDRQEAALAPADADFAEDVSAASAPSESDFADDAPTAVAPADDDFAVDTAPAAQHMPSTEHSAEDAANLAALLGPISTPAPEVEEPIVEVPAIEEPVAEAPVIEEPVAEDPFIVEPAAEAPVIEAVVEETLDVSLTVDAAPVEDVVPEAPLPAPEPAAKKAGFFSSLLKRVSRSQFMPKVAAEPEPEPPAIEFAETAAAEEAPLVEAMAAEEPAVIDELPAIEEAPAAEEPDHAELEAKWGPPATPPAPVPSDEDLGETVPSPMPAVPYPLAAKATEGELESTQPFPAFRDARDDFEEQPEPGRPTEKVEIPADDGEKTDEFEVVPAPEGEGTTAETRQVAGFWGRLFGKKVEDQPATDQSGEAAATAAADEKMPFVLAKFRTFYNEVIRDKHQKSDVISGFATAVMGSTGASEANDPEFAAQLLAKRLSEMLELQAAESNWTGGDAAKYYPEAQYAMVALADETFATIDWPGRPSWHKYMLEPRMYGTRGADIEFFKRIDKLLKEAPNEKGARDLARLYLMVIASGFRGKFRVPNVRRPLAEYRRRLYEYSHQSDPLDLYGKERRIFPAAVEHTLASRAVGRFTSAQKWVATVLVLVLLYIGFSHYAWTRLSADLKDVMSRIENPDDTGRTP